MRARPAVWLVAAGVCLGTGCARHLAPGLSQPPVPGEPTSSPAEQSIEAAPRVRERDRLEAREEAPRVRPASAAHGLSTVEQHDRQLAEALARLEAEPGGSSHRDVADAYRRLGLLDQAFAHYSAVIRLDRTDAAAYEKRARIWRDWGMAHLGLSDAYRAVFHAPLDAAAHNTLGTVLQAVGDRPASRAEYRRALELDPGAGYALNNLCYASFLDGRWEEATELCQAALVLNQGLTAARNNLALVYAARGLATQAEQQFAQAAGPAAAAYNMGIIHLAGRRFEQAAEAFDRAERAQPFVTDAPVRSREARRLAGRQSGGIE